MLTTARERGTSQFSYRVTWSVEDDDFVATCVEVPSLSWLAGSQAAALQRLVDLVADSASGLAPHGEGVAEP